MQKAHEALDSDESQSLSASRGSIRGGSARAGLGLACQRIAMRAEEKSHSQKIPAGRPPIFEPYHSPTMDQPLQAILEEDPLRKSDENVPEFKEEVHAAAKEEEPKNDQPKLDDYEILKEDVASGSFGSISIARSKKTGIKVALKKMDAERIQ